MLSGILHAAGLEPGITALHADAAKLQAMGQPRPPYAAEPLFIEVENLRVRVAELEAERAKLRRR